MSQPEPPSTNTTLRYAGSELELFARAANWKRYLARCLRPWIHGRVLEVGAGIGATTAALMTGAERSWTCLEPDPDLAQALARAVRDGATAPRVPVTVVAGTTADLRDDDLFDTILYVDVLEHIEDDAAELARAARHLSPAGHLAVLGPAHAWLFSPFDTAIGHFRRYSRETLAAAAPADCRLAVLRYVDSVGLLASLANRALLEESMPSSRQIAIWDRVMVPASRVLDPLCGYRLGKSVLGVWQRGAARAHAERGAHGP